MNEQKVKSEAYQRLNEARKKQREKKYNYCAPLCIDTVDVIKSEERRKEKNKVNISPNINIKYVDSKMEEKKYQWNTEIKTKNASNQKIKDSNTSKL